MARFTTLSLIVVLSATVIGCAFAARPEPAVNAGQWATSLENQGFTESSYSALNVDGSESGDSEKEHPFRVVTKFIVRPSIGKEFVKGWQKYYKEAVNASGAHVIELAKTISDNIVFWGCEEWESRADFLKWVKSEDGAAKIFALYIEENDVLFTITQINPVTPVPGTRGGQHHRQSWEGGLRARLASSAQDLSLEEITKLMAEVTETYFTGKIDTASGGESGSVSSSSSSSSSASSGGNEDKSSVTVLFRVLVKPSEALQFVVASNLFAKSVAENEKGSKLFVVSKTLDNDSEFFIYGVWDSKDAVKKHVEASYTKLFRNYVLNHDIYAKKSLLLPIEGEDE